MRVEPVEDRYMKLAASLCSSEDFTDLQQHIIQVSV